MKGIYLFWRYLFASRLNWYFSQNNWDDIEKAINHFRESHMLKEELKSRYREVYFLNDCAIYDIKVLSYKLIHRKLYD